MGLTSSAFFSQTTVEAPPFAMAFVQQRHGKPTSSLYLAMITPRSILALLWVAFVVEGFAPRIVPSRRSATAMHCICVDCAHVTNCAAYHFVETKHEQPHMNENPTFEPVDGSPTIHVNVRTIRTKEDRQAEAARMWREHQAEEAAATTSGENELHGQTVYDLSPVTTMEYDVVACESFVEEKGAWVKNMPEEIRKANPNFVPS